VSNPPPPGARGVAIARCTEGTNCQPQGEDEIYVSNRSVAPATGFGPRTQGGELVRIHTGT
jgi:hypothetical protein